MGELECGIQAVELRHADVHHGNVGILAAYQAHGLAAIGGFAGHDESCTFQQLPQSLPHEHVVVGEHQADSHAMSSIADARVLPGSIPRSPR